MHDEEEGEGRFRKRRGVPVRRGFLRRIGVWLLGAVIMGILPLTISLWVRSLVADYVPMLNQATRPLPPALRLSSRPRSA